MDTEYYNFDNPGARFDMLQSIERLVKLSLDFEVIFDTPTRCRLRSVQLETEC